MNKFPKLFIPGPTHVSENILNSMTNPQIGHRTSEFSDLMGTIVYNTQKVLYTKNRVYIASNPSTALWELSIINSVKKGILLSVNGAFSGKWAKVSKSCGFNTEILNTEWGKEIQINKIDKLLSTGKYDVFAMVHNETSTGAVTNLNKISYLLKEKYPDIIWIVDAVSSMAGIKIELDALGVDFIFASTQKAWGIPAGFSLFSATNRYREKSKSIVNKGYYFDIEVYDKYFDKMQTPSTPSIPHMFALKSVLKNIKEEGLENRWIRHLKMAEMTRKWALNNDQCLFPDKNCYSNTITCISNKRDWPIDKINRILLQKGYRMDRGYGQLRGKAFRIAHMGNIYPQDLSEYLDVFDSAVKEVI